jgi:hypothetical protein
MPICESTARYIAEMSPESIARLERMHESCSTCRWWQPYMAPSDSVCSLDLSGIPGLDTYDPLQDAFSYSVFFDEGEGDCPVPDADVEEVVRFARLELESQSGGGEG